VRNRLGNYIRITSQNRVLGSVITRAMFWWLVAGLPPWRF